MAVSGQFLVRTENRVLSHPQHFSEVILKSYSKDQKKLTLIYESNGVTSVRCLSMLYMALSTSPPSSPPPAPHIHHTLATVAHFQFPGLLNAFPLPGVVFWPLLPQWSSLFLSLINFCHSLSLRHLVTSSRVFSDLSEQVKLPSYVLSYSLSRS